MVADKFVVRDGRRWRMLDLSSGRLEGWGPARFVFVRGGRLERAPRAAVLRGLRALAAGRPRGVRCGPRLERSPRPESCETAMVEVNVPYCHSGCQQLSTRCCTDANFNRILKGAGSSVAVRCARASVGVQTSDMASGQNPGRRSDATDSSGSYLQISNEAKSKIRTKERNGPIVERRTSKRKPSQSGGVSAKQVAKRRKVDKKQSDIPTVDIQSSERKSNRSEESQTRRNDGMLKGSSSNTTKQTQESENECKELLITEDDVMLLRTFVENDTQNIFNVDLDRFDTDDTYKGIIFYKLNPLVNVERCRRIAEMLGSGGRSHRAGRLRDLAAVPGPQTAPEAASGRDVRGTRAGPGPGSGGTRAPTSGSSMKSTVVNDKEENEKNITKPKEVKHDANTKSTDLSKDTVTKSKEISKVTDTTSKEVNKTDNKSKDVNKDKVDKSKGTNKRINTKSKESNKDTVTNSKEVNKENVMKSVFVDRKANGQFKKGSRHRVLKENITTTTDQKIIVSGRNGTRTAGEAGARAAAREARGARRRAAAAPPKNAGREYSAPEDECIVRWVASGGRARRVNGNQVWQELQPEHERRTGLFRSWHSLRNRYLRYLLPALGSTSLPAAEASRLRVAAATGYMKRGMVPQRRHSMFPPPGEPGAWARRPRPALESSRELPAGPRRAAPGKEIEKDTGVESSEDARRARSSSKAGSLSRAGSSSRASSSSRGERSSSRGRRSSSRARSSSLDRSSSRGRSSSRARSSPQAGISSHGRIPPRAMVRVPTPTYSELTRRFARRYRSTPNSGTSSSDSGPGPRRRTRSGRGSGRLRDTTSADTDERQTKVRTTRQRSLRHISDSDGRDARARAVTARSPRTGSTASAASPARITRQMTHSIQRQEPSDSNSDSGNRRKTLRSSATRAGPRSVAGPGRGRQPRTRRLFNPNIL